MSNIFLRKSDPLLTPCASRQGDFVPYGHYPSGECIETSLEERLKPYLRSKYLGELKYSNIGCREINQDYLASLSFDQDKSIHLVADGIGGYDCGEIASKIVCDSYIHGLVNNLSIDEATKEASRNIQAERQNLGVSKMGSTVAAVFLNGFQASIFWAGDSRVYVFRDKHLLYKTEDHSLLNELSRVRELRTLFR